jgi:hypothetical protein
MWSNNDEMIAYFDDHAETLRIESVTGAAVGRSPIPKEWTAEPPSAQARLRSRHHRGGPDSGPSNGTRPSVHPIPARRFSGEDVRPVCGGAALEAVEEDPPEAQPGDAEVDG